MKLVTFQQNHETAAGVLRGDGVVNLKAAGFQSVAEVIAAGTQGVARIAKWLSSAPAGALPEIVPLERVRLLAPIQPPRVFCVGLNYRDHAVESKMEIPKVPTIFLKLPTAVIGPGEPIRLPVNSQQVDYEAEFALVIGRGGFRIKPEEWRGHVFGYLILNDVSARDVQLATTQWTLGKSFPSFCPIGPAITTADEIADPHALQVQLSIGGVQLQNSNTRELIFRIPELIAYISSITPLQEGDIISTGTPAGVGLGQKPQRWLQPGETVTISISGLGQLSNPVLAE